MPRKVFLADLEKLHKSCPWEAVSGIRRGEDDMFHFCVTAPVAPNVSEVVEIACVVLPELAEYPNEHYYQMFLEDDNAPDCIAHTIQKLPPMTGFSLSNAIAHVTQLILDEGSSMTGNSDSQNKDSSLGDGSDYPEDDEEQEYESEGDDVDNFWLQRKASSFNVNNIAPEPVASGVDLFSRTEMQLIRIDIAMAKAAGFKVACYGNIFRCPMNLQLCLSIRISKLGISEDAMEAWKVEEDDYLILAFCYKSGYKSFASLLTENTKSVKYKIGLSKTYRPTYTTVSGIFCDLRCSREEWRPTFISKPLEELMNKRFLLILKNRSEGLGWSGAERLYHAQEGHQTDGGVLPDAYRQPDEVHGTYPEVVTYDHYLDPLNDTNHRSFPLLAMQFLLRHFVRCTEFCLVCHRPLRKFIEAIKPYVCEEPLCLYQYMSLGFGPGIEHEILTQPFVVDLLISFAWASSKGRRLAALPRGLGLLVPSIRLLDIKGPDFHYQTGPQFTRGFPHRTTAPTQVRLATPPPTAPPVDSFADQTVMVNWEKQQLFFEYGKPHHLTPGMWLSIVAKSENIEETKIMHCKVVKTYPDRLDFSEPFGPLDEISKNETTEPVRVVKYDQNFDELPDQEAQASLLLQINLLPSVAQMETYLRQHPNRTLAEWHERFSPAAIGILRWIIASNRACIKEDCDNSIVKDISNMKQFRFTMGAPDKEKRFVDQVIDTKKRLNLTHPTILAFHGSPIYNWHGIIREGLHFKHTAHGRAYGDGVYHALQFDVSNGYTHGVGQYNNQFQYGDCWNRSKLLVQGAVAINEVVNAPREFVSSSPYLVINNVDWIQTRYLLVTCKVSNIYEQDKDSTAETNNESTNDPTIEAGNEVETIVVDGFMQDPSMPITFPQQRTYSTLPLRAGSYTRLLGTNEPLDPRKRKAQVLEYQDDAIDDNSSVCTFDDDKEIFTSDEIWKKFVQIKNGQARVAVFKETVEALQIREQVATESIPKSSTNFIPGALDHSTLPRLPPPTNASTAASKAIMTSLKAIQITLETEDIIELGWYVDVQQVDNIFQWIIELHSFPEDLPLTKQMVESKIPSIVFELRFPDQFPFVPPFARVIRPRMLPFASGGGGHITAGGSICMELLTASGWTPALSIMNILLNIRLAICETEPFPAQLARRLAYTRNWSVESENANDYGIGEAIDGYLRACRAHGWTIPEGFREWSARM